jgi:hypothetical protein
MEGTGNFLSFHDFELHENGDVTARRSWGVGPGKKYPKATLEKMYVRKDEQSRELQAPEPELRVTESELLLPGPELQVPEPEFQVPEQELQVPEQELRFPQGSTGATFTTVLAVESLVPKFEPSKARKRERDAEIEQKTAGRKKRQMEARQATQAKLHSVKDERYPHKCLACGNGYKRQGDLEGHNVHRTYG